MKRLAIILILLSLASVASSMHVWVPEDTDAYLILALVDESDGYTPETEKKAADTTITYCDVTDGNSVSTYTDADGTSWWEIGDGTGEYKLMIGATEFDDPDHVYLVKVAVSGCRTARLWCHTLHKPLGQIAQTTAAGRTIDVAATGEVGVDLSNVNGTLDDAEVAYDVKVDVNSVRGETPSTKSDVADVVVTYMDANSVDLNTIIADTSEVQADWADGGRLDSIVDAILADTGSDGVVIAPSSKTGFKLASDGLDTVSITEPTGRASNFREMVVQVWMRFFNKVTTTSTTLTVYADDETTPVTTQTLSDSRTQTQGEAN